MKIGDLSFLHELPAGKRKKAFLLGFSLWTGLLLIIWLLLSGSVGGAKARIATLEKRFQSVSPIAEETLRMESQLAALAGLSPLAAAQQVTRDLKLESRLSTIRPNKLGGDREGVQMIFEALNLPQLLDLLKNLKGRGGLKVVSATLSRRLDASKRADLQLILVR
ncbi:MAG: hypothetical protein SVS15_03755 [Thermodesulfobacteriota bacterium]|nr:hypothetical protein [Thermodesulfobacteriota bacterium]